MDQSNEDEKICETVVFKIDEAKSTKSVKFVVRTRIVKHEQNNKQWTEVFEDTFTIPLHNFNTNVLVNQDDRTTQQSNVINVQKTIFIQRKVSILKIETFIVWLFRNKRIVEA